VLLKTVLLLVFNIRTSCSCHGYLGLFWTPLRLSAHEFAVATVALDTAGQAEVCDLDRHTAVHVVQ